MYFADDGETVYMTEETWKKLARYDTSMPSGVYEGKMWRGGGWLCWWAPGNTPNTCRVESRRAVVCSAIRRNDGRVCYFGNASRIGVAHLFPICMPDHDVPLSALTDQAVTCIECMAQRGER